MQNLLTPQGEGKPPTETHPQQPGLSQPVGGRQPGWPESWLAQQLHGTHGIHATFFGSRERTNKTITCVTYSSLLRATASNAESWPNFFQVFHETGPSSDWSTADRSTLKQLFCSRMEVLPHHSKIQSVPVQGLACCHHSLHAAQAWCAPAEGELCYGVTSVYFCTPFNTLLGPPSFFWDDKAPLWVQLAVFKLYVQNPGLPHM